MIAIDVVLPRGGSLLLPPICSDWNGTVQSTDGKLSNHSSDGFGYNQCLLLFRCPDSQGPDNADCCPDTHSPSCFCGTGHLWLLWPPLNGVWLVILFQIIVVDSKPPVFTYQCVGCGKNSHIKYVSKWLIWLSNWITQGKKCVKSVQSHTFHMCEYKSLVIQQGFQYWYIRSGSFL